MVLGPNSVHWSNYIPYEYRVVVSQKNIENTELFNQHKWRVVIFPEYLPGYYVCIFKRKQHAIELQEKLRQLKIVTYGNWF